MISVMMQNPQVGVAMIFMIILAVSLHEMAHAWASYKLGDDTAAHLGRLTLNPAAHFDPIGLTAILLIGFGWGKPVPVDPRFLKNPTRDMMWIAAAGPISNVIQAAALALLFHFVTIPAVMHTALSLPSGEAILQATILVCEIGVYFNFILALFNMIPLFPLDGEKILVGLLPYEQARKVEDFRQYSPMVLMVLIFSGFFLPFSIIGAYLGMTAGPLCSLFLGFSPFNLF